MAIMLNRRNIRILSITGILLFLMFFIVHQRDSVEISRLGSVKYQGENNRKVGDSGDSDSGDEVLLDFYKVSPESDRAGDSFDEVDSGVVYGDDLRQADEEAEYLAEMELTAKEKEQEQEQEQEQYGYVYGNGNEGIVGDSDIAKPTKLLSPTSVSVSETLPSDFDVLDPTFIPPYPDDNHDVQHKGQRKGTEGGEEETYADNDDDIGNPHVSSMEFSPEEEYAKILRKSPVIIFSKTTCPYSRRLKELFRENYEFTPEYYIVEVDTHPHGAALREYIGKVTERTTVPNVVINGVSRGGFDDMKFLHDDGILLESLRSWGEGTFQVDRITAA